MYNGCRLVKLDVGGITRITHSGLGAPDGLEVMKEKKIHSLSLRV